MEFVDSTTLIIGDVVQYFFDNAAIDQIQDITRNMQMKESLLKSEKRYKKDEEIAHVGGPRMLEKLNVSLSGSLSKFTDVINEKGQTVIYLFVEQEPVAAFARPPGTVEETPAAELLSEKLSPPPPPIKDQDPLALE